MRTNETLQVLAALLAAGCLLAGTAVAQDVRETLPDLSQPGAPQSPLPPSDESHADDQLQPGTPEQAKPDAASRDADDSEVTQSPMPKDRDTMLAELYAHLAKATDATQAEPIAKTIEGLWLNSGSDTISLLVRRSIKAVSEERNDVALKLLDAVVDLGPDYAEGWSRRAYVHYLQNDYDRAVGDLRRALALEPNHFKALDGLARILRDSGQKKSALKVYEQLLRIHPYMPGAKEAADELRVEVEGQGI